MGLGTAALGGLFRHVSDDDAQAVVQRALDRGLTYLDTAPQYGHGTAERRVGEVLREVPRTSFVLSTKVGWLIEEAADAQGSIFADAPPSRAVFDFSRDGVLRSLEQSLDRLGLDRVDLVYLHDPDDHKHQALDEAYPALEELRASGVVQAIGVGMNQSRIPTRFVRETDIDVVLLAGRYALLDQSGADDLLPEAAARGSRSSSEASTTRGSSPTRTRAPPTTTEEPPTRSSPGPGASPRPARDTRYP
jgi:D-threo-aldose 1-dehydrogenase